MTFRAVVATRVCEAQASQISGAVEALGRDRFAAWVREEAFERVR